MPEDETRRWRAERRYGGTEQGYSDVADPYRPGRVRDLSGGRYGNQRERLPREAPGDPRLARMPARAYGSLPLPPPLREAYRRGYRAGYADAFEEAFAAGRHAGLQERSESAAAPSGGAVDRRLHHALLARLRQPQEGTAFSRVWVEVRGGVATFHGEVPEERFRRRLDWIGFDIYGVGRVHNLVSVRPPHVQD